MRIAAGVILACLAVSTAPSCAAPGQAQSSVTRTFDGWTATCDNLRNCVAIGSSDDGDGLFYLRVAMGAAATARPKIKVVLATADPMPTAARSFQLALERGGVDDRYTVEATKDDADGTALSGEIAETTFLPAITKAQALDYVAAHAERKACAQGSRWRADLHR